jgi:LPXTG-motif cell wall-anchored protein
MRMRRWLAAFVTSLLTFGAVMALSAGTAFAITADYLCNAYDEGGAPLPLEDLVPLAIEDVTASAPATIRPFETFEISIPPRLQPLPEEVDALGQTFPIIFGEALRFRIGIVGGTLVGGSGEKVGGSDSSSVTVNAASNYVQFEVPDQISGGQSFDVPGATFKVIAGADGRVRTTTRTGASEQDLQLDITVSAAGLEVRAHAQCTSDFNTVSSTNIAGDPVGPPPTTIAPTTTVPSTTATTSPPVTPAQTPTTAAPGELPRTGDSSAPIGLAGFAAVAAGLAVLGLTRRRLVAAEERD